MLRLKKLSITLTFTLIGFLAFAQNDSLVFNKNILIVGEVKSMDRGVVHVKTDFSDKDFAIEWDKIKSINTETYFLILTSFKTRHYGLLKSSSDTTLMIVNFSNNIELKLEDIVMLVPFEEKFGDRFSAAIDFGFSLTKANNLKQLTSRSSLGYKAKKWSSEAVFNYLGSVSENADTVKRAEGGIVFQYLFYDKWFISFTESALSATEQNLRYRLNTRLGLGRFIVHTNRSQWTARFGVNRNNERFTDNTPNRNSWESYVGTEVDLFDIGDLNLVTRINAYKGITESSRWRVDGVFDVKYDLPLDLYIKAGISFNYDNIPAEDASTFDYVLQTGLGWEW